MQWFARLCCVKQASYWGWKSHVEVGDEESRLPTRLGQPHQVPGHDEKRPAMHAAGDDKRRPLLLRRSWCVRAVRLGLRTPTRKYLQYRSPRKTK